MRRRESVDDDDDGNGSRRGNAAAVVAAAVKLAVAGFDALGAAAADLPAAEAAPTSICACRRVCIMLRSQGRGSKARPKFSSQSD